MSALANELKLSEKCSPLSERAVGNEILAVSQAANVLLI